MCGNDVIAELSCVMRKPNFCIWESKGTATLHGNRAAVGGNHTADEHLCFRNIDSTIPLLSKSKISSP